MLGGDDQIHANEDNDGSNVGSGYTQGLTRLTLDALDAMVGDMARVDEADRWLDALLSGVRAELAPTVREHLRRGHPPSDRPIDELVRMMTAAIPKPSAWNDAIGPFYDTAGARRLLGISRQALAQQRARHQILALGTADGELVYPAFQFDDHRRVIPGLAAVLGAVAGIDSWTLASWLRQSRLAELGGRSVIEYLRDHGEPEVAVASARRAAARWAA